MKDLRIFLFLSILALISFNFPSFVFASVEWAIDNKTIAPVDNFFMNITWTNSTVVGTGDGDYKLNNITFNLTNTTGSLSLIYIDGSYDSNVENLTFNSTETSTSSLLIWGNDTVYTTQTEAWFAFNVSAPQAGVYEISVEEAYSNGTDYIISTSTLLLTIEKASTEVKLYFNGTEGNRTYVRGQVANITATVNVTGKNVTIEFNFGSNVTVVNGPTPLTTTIQTANLNAGTYNITAYFVEDENYTGSSKTYWLTITLLSNGSPCNANYQCAGGYCVHGICRSSPTYCGDSYCDSGETCSNCQADCGRCPSPSYGPAPTRPSIIVHTEPGKGLVYLSFVKANEKTNITFEKRGDLNIFELNILIVNKANSVSISVTKLDERPAEVHVDVVGRAYRYLKITKENLRDQDISQAKIKFFVEKSWITENNIDPSTIALYRFSENKWNRLTTNKLTEDSNYIYYEAETPGFSYFAIVGEQGKQACPFECCVGEANYYDKACASGYRCENRRCVAVAVCEENWVCSEWGECVQGWQTRTCRDINNCGTTQRKPIEAQSCAVPTVIISTELLVGIAAIIILVIGVLAWKFVRKKRR
ncbi:MAG: PGF-pre-PGF domain-containing protein [Candidatus Aenigmatarchaeota archaeon]